MNATPVPSELAQTRPEQSAHAGSANPLFDELVSSVRPARRPLTPITTATRWIDRVKARSVVFAEDTTPLVQDPRPAGPIARERLTQNPLSEAELTAEERAIVAEMGGTVARLILRMLDEDDKKGKRR